jgi:hypothetical protein
MPKHYLVVYDKTHVLSIEDMPNAQEAMRRADAIQDAHDGRIPQVITASSREALGIQVGDPKNNEDGEFSFRGF